VKRLICLMFGHPGWVDREARWETWWPDRDVPGRHPHWDGISFIGHCVRCGARDKTMYPHVPSIAWLIKP